MDLSPYLETVRRGVTDAAALADEPTRQVADRLGGAVESSTRLALISALADAAAQVSAEIAPTSVELRMAGPDPELVVLVPAPAAEPTMLLPDPDPGVEPTAVLDPEDPLDPLGDDEPVARISLRLPASVKARVDDKADREQISTNAWLLKAVLDALEDRPVPPTPPSPPTPPDGGPFGPYGVFGPNGPFGPGGMFGRRETEHRAGAPTPPAPSTGRRGTVQGWVR